MSRDLAGARLESARREAGLSVDELWIRYAGNGGTASPHEFSSFLASSTRLGQLQYDIVVSALNERFTEMDRNHPVPYSDASTACGDGSPEPQ